MDKHALVLIGTLLPGHDADKVWPALASYFRMDEHKVADQLVPRAPVTLKESEDLAKLQGLQDGLVGIGAESEIHPLDERGSVFVVIAGRPRGPVPFSFVAARVANGEWSGATEVAEVGSERWQPFSRMNAASTPPAAPPPLRGEPVEHTVYTPSSSELAQASANFARPAAARLDAQSGYGSPRPGGLAPDGLEHGEMLPAGDAIHAGFWRRGAAMFLDALVILIPSMILSVIPFLGWLLQIVGVWLYYALMESSPAQATFGKQAFGIKVVDDYGRRIDFARATGRHFAKILSAILLMIGYIMAGLTVRKQGLHDSLASCCVVFREVDPGQPLPTSREPLPWYGWALNIVFLTLPPASVLFFFVLASGLSGWH
ncbi:MAG TPA: RDD family protein [Tahibacter sp.]|nr:RDD family protein [Tahibacter sp.]